MFENTRNLFSHLRNISQIFRHGESSKPEAEICPPPFSDFSRLSKLNSSHTTDDGETIHYDYCLPEYSIEDPSWSLPSHLDFQTDEIKKYTINSALYLIRQGLRLERHIRSKIAGEYVGQLPHMSSLFNSDKVKGFRQVESEKKVAAYYNDNTGYIDVNSNRGGNYFHLLGDVALALIVAGEDSTPIRIYANDSFDRDERIREKCIKALSEVLGYVSDYVNQCNFQLADNSPSLWAAQLERQRLCCEISLLICSLTEPVENIILELEKKEQVSPVSNQFQQLLKEQVVELYRMLNDSEQSVINDPGAILVRIEDINTALSILDGGQSLLAHVQLFHERYQKVLECDERIKRCYEKNLDLMRLQSEGNRE